MYPSLKRECVTDEAKKLQKVFIVLSWLHVILTILAFTLVGPKSMIMNTLCAMLSYSSYLNMKASSMWGYFVILFISLGMGVWEFFDDGSQSGKKGNIQLLSKIVVCCCYLIFSLYTWPLFRKF